jgi:hypothetical protein
MSRGRRQRVLQPKPRNINGGASRRDLISGGNVTLVFRIFEYCDAHGCCLAVLYTAASALIFKAKLPRGIKTEPGRTRRF